MTEKEDLGCLGSLEHDWDGLGEVIRVWEEIYCA